MVKETKNNVREWTDEDERKYRKMLATPLKKPTEEEMFELTSASPNPPLGASKKVKSLDIDLNKLAEMQKENREIMENLKQATETPLFGQGNDNFAQAITEAGIKAAKATHEFNMMEIKTKLIADLTIELARRTSNGRLDGNFIGNKVNEIVNAVFKDE